MNGQRQQNACKHCKMLAVMELYKEELLSNWLKGVCQHSERLDLS